MPFVAAASFRVKTKYLRDFTRRVRRHANNCVTKEAGCISFDVSIDRQDPRRFLLYEVYVDEAAFDTHYTYPHLKKHLRETESMIDGDVEIIGLWNRSTSPNK